MTRAVLLDALGTLVELQPPAARLRALLADEGFDVSEEATAAAFGTEVRYYLAHHLDGADRASLDDLRDRCAAVFMEALALPGLDRATARGALLGALSFTPFADTVPALTELRARGLRLVIASNWDCSLRDFLAPLGLLDLVDGVVTSGGVGAAKPAAAVFEAALACAGVEAGDAVHVGDSFENDVVGARAIGIRPVLAWRAPEPAPGGVAVVRTLTELGPLL